MQEYFEKFLLNIELTSIQKTDAKTKYKGVCEKIHNSFYDSKYDGKTKFLFGSYKKKTNIRPIIPSQDVDVLIKLPIEIYEQYDKLENGQSQLIQKIKKILKDEKYTTTDNIKGWGKVILVEFKEGKHNIELLPAFENEDGTFEIPNSSNGGKWETFDPRQEVDTFLNSNDDTNGLTRKLSKIVKKWARTVSSLNIKSYKIEEYIIDFLDDYEYGDNNLSIIVQDFYSYFVSIVDESDKSYVETATNRINKAISFIEDEKYENAVEEWKKIFGDDFPKTICIKKTIGNLYKSPNEEFIDNYFNIYINPSYIVNIGCKVQQNGFRIDYLSSFLSKGIRLKKNKDLFFYLEKCNVPEPFDVKWKVRNFGVEAEKANGLRGEILSDNGSYQRKEVTSYYGDHIMECFIIKDNICVATGEIQVLI